MSEREKVVGYSVNATLSSTVVAIEQFLVNLIELH